MTEEEQVTECVEVVCQHGCRSVRRVIALLERGETVPETRGLRADLVAQVLAELKAVMAAYDTCR